MKKIVLWVLLCFTLPVSACKGEDERPAKIRYGFVAEDQFPVVVFGRLQNDPFGQGSDPVGQFRNSGWQQGKGNTTIAPQYFEQEDLQHILRFDATWFEVLSDLTFSATIEGDVRQLHRGWSDADTGEVALRIGAGGVLELVSAKTTDNPSETTVTVLARICGQPKELSDFQKDEVIRVTESLGFLKQQKQAYQPNPANCEVANGG